MARFLTWSPQAAEDVESIALYIERDSAQYARAVVSQIVAIAESISEFPQMGRVVPEIDDLQYRERFVHKYRIIYHLEEERVLVVAVIHGHQNFAAHISRVKDAS